MSEDLDIILIILMTETSKCAISANLSKKKDRLRVALLSPWSCASRKLKRGVGRGEKVISVKVLGQQPPVFGPCEPLIYMCGRWRRRLRYFSVLLKIFLKNKRPCSSSRRNGNQSDSIGSDFNATEERCSTSSSVTWQACLIDIWKIPFNFRAQKS